MKRITMLLGAGILILCSTVFAVVPQLINFQGILRDGSGNPVANGSYFATFRIYDVPAGGTVMWGDTQTVVTSSGLFNAILGRGTPIPDSVFNDSVRYLGVQVFPDPEMTPRQRLSSVGYSYNSSEWTSAAQDLFRLNGNVGIGTASPTTRLQVNGTVTASSFSGSFGQSVTSTFGTAGLAVTTATFTLIPGLSQTITVPSNSVLYIATDGGVQTSSASTTGFSTVDVVVMIDGSLAPNGGYRRLQVANTGGVTTKMEEWSLSLSAVLAPGSHTIDVRASLVTGSTATVSGNVTSVLQGELTVAIIKQ